MEAACVSGGLQLPTHDLSQQVAEAEGSLALEARSMGGSSPDNDGADRHYQTV